MNISHIAAIIAFSVWFLVLFTACSKVDEPPIEVKPLVYCHAQGGVVVDGKCVAHRRPQ